MLHTNIDKPEVGFVSVIFLGLEPEESSMECRENFKQLVNTASFTPVQQELREREAK